MDPRSFELAAEFCALAGVPSLLHYLGAPDSDDATDLRARLKKRRKYMQGMQGNPKYKQEALLLIKHYTLFGEVLGELPAYRQDVRRRAESQHLPVLEMTIRGVLASGGLNGEQKDFLRHNALQLGIADVTFEETIKRLAAEAGIPMMGGLPTPPPAPLRGQATDLYAILGVNNRATVADIDAAYAMRRRELESGLPDADHLRKLDIARKVLSNEAARVQYDQTAARTGPPVKRREFEPPKPKATAPPVRPRSWSPDAPAATNDARLEILGEPVRVMKLVGARNAVERVRIRNGGSGPMPGTAVADVPWVRVKPSALDPDATEQALEVTAIAGEAPEGASTAVVTVSTERGERARVVFELQRSPAPPWALIGVVVAVVIAAVAVGLLLQGL
jgi:hypothetical protein